MQQYSAANIGWHQLAVGFPQRLMHLLKFAKKIVWLTDWETKKATQTYGHVRSNSNYIQLQDSPIPSPLIGSEGPKTSSTFIYLTIPDTILQWPQ